MRSATANNRGRFRMADFVALPYPGSPLGARDTLNSKSIVS
jgi:hypothetical protein